MINSEQDFCHFFLNESRLIKLVKTTQLEENVEELEECSVVQVSLDADIKGEELETTSNLYESLYRDQVSDVIAAILKLESIGYSIPSQITFESLGMSLICSRSQWSLRKRWTWSIVSGVKIPSHEYKFRFIFSIV